MSINEFSYLWTTEKDNYVLVDSEYGYAIINKIEQNMLCISDDSIEKIVIEKMLKEGNKIYKNIKEAYSDIDNASISD